MARRYLFTDEAGDFEFQRKPNVSRYFIVCAIRAESCDVGTQLLELRRQLVWEGQAVGPYFHASEDRQAIRNRVFALIRTAPIRIYATIMEKSKAQPHIRVSKARFYKYGWYYLLRFIAPQLAGGDNELLVTAASLGTRKEQAHFTHAVNDVLGQTIRNPCKTTFCPAQSDPCLQIADYCTWAIQRRWESGGRDLRSYELIRPQIDYEYDLWDHGTTHYY